VNAILKVRVVYVMEYSILVIIWWRIFGRNQFYLLHSWVVVSRQDSNIRVPV